MEVRFNPDTERRLAAVAARTRRLPEDLLENAIQHLEELAGVHEKLDSSYDELKSGRVQPIPGDQLEAYFRDKSDDARRGPKAD